MPSRLVTKEDRHSLTFCGAHGQYFVVSHSRHTKANSSIASFHFGSRLLLRESYARHVDMAPKQSASLLCTACKELRSPAAFSENQRRRNTRKCKSCLTPATTDTLTCTQCKEKQPRTAFSNNQVDRATRKCKQCTTDCQQRSGHTRTQTVAFDTPCSFCGAMLLPTETSKFCCNSGRYAICFDKFFATPGPALCKLFETSWPLLQPDGKPQLDIQTHRPLLTGFSASSRRYNNMFCLAQHAVHSASLPKELRFGGPQRPANIRIQGTMYRMVHSAAEKTPLRYLLVDPREQADMAQLHNLDTKTLKRLQTLLVSHNSHMQELRRLAEAKDTPPQAAIRLEWHEGVDEVAAVVDLHPTQERRARSVTFHRQGGNAPEYVHPLSPLYEPLSYPLWYPKGGLPKKKAG